MDNKLYAVWPLCYNSDLDITVLDYETALERAALKSAKIAPICLKCKRVHWFSWSAPGRHGWIERAVVDTDRDKMKEMARVVFEETGLIGRVQAFNNLGYHCPKMYLVFLDEFYREQHRAGGKGNIARVIL